MKTILLTGGTGFLGSHLLRELVRANEYKIIILKRKTSSFKKIENVCENSVFQNKNVSFIDFSDDFDIKQFFRENKISIMIHAATNYGRNENPSSVLKSNLIFPITLIEEAVKNGLELFINTDSYFNKPNQSYKNLLDYSLSKKSFNLWLEYYSSKVKIVNLRLEHIFGDFDNDNKFCESIIQQIAVKKKNSINLTNGEQKRDFVFVDDVCNAYIQILKNYKKFFFNYLLFDVGTGVATSIRDFVSYVKEISKSDTELLFGTLPYREDEIMISYADVLPLYNWGFKSKFSWKEGVEKIIKIYRSL